MFLPYGGVEQLPTEFEEVGSEAGRLGYHTIVLAYKNEVPIAAPAGCGNARVPPASPPNCAINARMEILDGRGESPVVDVDQANSIENRLNKVLAAPGGDLPRRRLVEVPRHQRREARSGLRP